MHEGHRERLRERYSQAGLDGFAEHEVLELLLTYAIPRRNTNDIAHRLLERFGTLDAVCGAQVGELTKVEGVGERAALFLKMQADVRAYLHKRMRGRKRYYRLSTPAEAAAYSLELLKHERYECVYAVSLNKNYGLIHAERLLTGTLTEAPLYPRRVVESALQNKAYAVLLLHNHPSGDPTPSGSDLSATESVKQALNVIDIRLYDHLIVGKDMVYSYRKQFFIDSEGEVHVKMPMEGGPGAREEGGAPLSGGEGL